MKKLYLFSVLNVLFTLLISAQQIQEKQFAAGIDLALMPSISFGIGVQYNINSKFTVIGNLGLSGDFKVTGISGQYKLGFLGTKQTYFYAMFGSMSHNSTSKGTIGLGIGVNYFMHPKIPIYGMLEFGYLSMPDFEDVVKGIPLSISLGLKYGFSLY
jgi:hypothetical protein